MCEIFGVDASPRYRCPAAVINGSHKFEKRDQSKRKRLVMENKRLRKRNKERRKNSYIESKKSHDCRNRKEP